MATVYIPALLRERAGGAERVELEIPPGERATVRQVLEMLERRHPGLGESLLYQGELMPGIAVFIDDEQALMGLKAKVDAASEVRFVPPVVGG